MASATRPSALPGCGGGEAPEGDREPQRGQRVRRGAAAVDADGGDGLARQVRHRLADGTLQRVLGVEVVLDRPAVHDAGREHRRVLAGAVLRKRRRRTAGGSPRETLVLVQGKGRCVAQRRDVETDTGEEPEDAVEVIALAGVARAGEGQQVPLEGQARPEHRDSLQRLVGGPREDRRLRGARAARRHRRDRSPRRCRGGCSRRSPSGRPERGRRGSRGPSLGLPRPRRPACPRRTPTVLSGRRRRPRRPHSGGRSPR